MPNARCFKILDQNHRDSLDEALDPEEGLFPLILDNSSDSRKAFDLVVADTSQLEANERLFLIEDLTALTTKERADWFPSANEYAMLSRKQEVRDRGKSDQFLSGTDLNSKNLRTTYLKGR